MDVAKSLSDLFKSHNASQPRGGGVRLSTQLTGNVVYIIYSGYTGGQRGRRSLGLSLPINSHPADIRRIAAEAIQMAKDLNKNAGVLNANLSKVIPKKQATEPENTLGKLYDQYLKRFDAPNFQREKTARNRVIEFWGENKPIAEIKRHEGEEFLLYLERERKHAVNTIATVAGRAKTFFRWCINRDLMTVLPTMPRKLQKTDPKTKAFTDEELKRLASTPCPDQNLKNMFFVGCMSGVRKVDLLSFKFSDLGEIKNGKYIVKDIHKYRQHKTGLQCNFFIIPESKRLILEQWELHGKQLDHVVFFMPQWIQGKIWKPWLKEAGITRNLKVYYLRHTCATYLRSKNFDVRDIQKIVGWESLDYVDRVYMGEDEQDLYSKATKLGKIRSVPKKSRT